MAADAQVARGSLCLNRHGCRVQPRPGLEQQTRRPGALVTVDAPPASYLCQVADALDADVKRRRTVPAC
jgi:hypothetical protein